MTRQHALSASARGVPDFLSHPHPGASDDRGAAWRPRTGTGMVLFPRNPRAQKEARGRRPPVGPPTSTTRSAAPMPRRTSCLLYTSDAADDLLCVDLGGRRIIKKKKKN